jgi:hypothetical protein
MMEHLEDIVKWEEGTLSEQDTVNLFQKLINEGHAWRLQGFYGAMATTLIDEGLCFLPDSKEPTNI